jgi:hypothetical protein
MASTERVEMARLADSAAARKQEMARSVMEMQRQDAMAMQSQASVVQGEGGQAGPAPAQPDRGMEAVGMGLQAIAEVMGRPKQVIRGPSGQVEGIG